MTQWVFPKCLNDLGWFAGEGWIRLWRTLFLKKTFYSIWFSSSSLAYDCRGKKPKLGKKNELWTHSVFAVCVEPRLYQEKSSNWFESVTGTWLALFAHHVCQHKPQRNGIRQLSPPHKSYPTYFYRSNFSSILKPATTLGQSRRRRTWRFMKARIGFDSNIFT